MRGKNQTTDKNLQKEIIKKKKIEYMQP